MVPQRPFLSGRPGWVRSSAWICDFSSTHRGGFAKAMRAKKYVQSHTVFEDAGRQIRGTRKMTETYDGITEVWWDTLEDFSSGGDPKERAEAARALLEDESKFVDFERSSIFLTEEHEIFDYTK
jgi:hypothetical protein